MGSKNHNREMEGNERQDSVETQDVPAQVEGVKEAGVVSVSKIPVARRFAIARIIRQQLAEKLGEIQDAFDSLGQAYRESFLATEEGVLFPLDASLQLLVADPLKYKMRVNDAYLSYNSKILQEEGEKPAGVDWKLPTFDQVKPIFGYFKEFLFKTQTLFSEGIQGVTYISDLGSHWFAESITENSVETHGYDYSSHRFVADLNVHQVQGSTALAYCLNKGFRPALSAEYLMKPDGDGGFQKVDLAYGTLNQQLTCLVDMVAQGMVSIAASEKRYVFTLKEKGVNRAIDRFLQGTNLTLGEWVISCQSVEKALEGGQLVLGAEEAAGYVNALRCGDFKRANITEYDSKQFEDPNRGSWELFDAMKRRTGDVVTMPVARSLYARNPALDVQQGGVIGIDFGTKSTVVVCLGDDNQPHPLRVGTGRFEQAPSARDYENPTVMHFIDIETFMSRYKEKNGRPYTCWSDLTVSHVAAEDWEENADTSNYFSYFGELKQWAGTPKRQIRIRDMKNHELTLPPYDGLKPGDFDPIELYAYYIGLYINNQNTGKIFLEYLLSFPISFEMDLRERLLESFRRGLKQSLPTAILSNQECMEQFSVSSGVSEPAAYAVCALQEFEVMRKEEGKIFYGIFDFGGGTADFDFGIWRRAEGARERRYHYVITHFGDSGDRFLGGENLLEDLAYLVFRDNQELLRKQDISFAQPADPCCGSFPGSERLMGFSQEARSNTKLLMEQLRPFWENTADQKKNKDSGVIKVRLFKRTGETLENQELKCDYNRLEAFLQNRISQGVDQFMDAYRDTVYKHKSLLENAEKLHVFLAGNSSKSERLKAIFKEKIKAHIDRRKAEAEEKGEEAPGLDDSIVIYPPLGTEEANQLVRPGICDVLERPTGKTGVAMGLVQCREGSRIKVNNPQPENHEIRFRFSIGLDDPEGFFETVISRESDYGKWFELIDAGEGHFEFYGSTSPSAEIRQTLRVDMARKYRESLPKSAVNGDWMVYLRCVSPDEIEYTVAASEEDVAAGRFQFAPVRVKLEEVRA